MRALTPEAENEYWDWYTAFENRGCTCFTGVAPCGSCTHPGNPVNQEEDESAWMEVWDLDEAIGRAKEDLEKDFNKLAIHHRSQIRLNQYKALNQLDESHSRIANDHERRVKGIFLELASNTPNKISLHSLRVFFKSLEAS